MSMQTSLNLWYVTKKEIARIIRSDRKTVRTWTETRKELRDTNKLTNIFANLFLDYCKIVQDMGKVLEQMCQVQERVYIKSIFDAVNARLCELKDSLCLVALSQFIYLDNFMIERRLVPQDVQFVTPSHLRRDNRDPEMQILFSKIMEGLRIYTAPAEEEEDEDEEEEEDKKDAGPLLPPMPEMDEEDEDDLIDTKKKKELLPHENPNISPERRAILYKKWLYTQKVIMIQTCERVRVARIRAAAALMVRRVRFLGYKRKALPPVEEQVPYVIKIQAFWRGYNARKILELEKFEREILMRKVRPSWRSKELFDNIEKNIEDKHQRRLKYVENLKELTQKEETRIMIARNSSMLEDITDEIIEWMTVWYERTNWFDAFPEVVDGGSVLIVTGQTKTIEEYLLEKEQAAILAQKYAEDPKAKKKDEDDAKKKKAEEKRKAKELKKKLRELERARKRDIFPLYKWEITPPMEMIMERSRQFQRVWGNIPLEENPQQDKLYEEFVTADILAQLNIKLREHIDELMRIEYNLLVEAVNRDRVQQKLGALPKPRFKAEKQKKKKKEPKDLTADRDVEDIFQEFVDRGIIHSYPKVGFDDFISEWNFAACDMRTKHQYPTPCPEDTIASLRTDCILAMGSREAPRSKGVLIMGPKQTGKKLLINIILNEIGAVLFDLSPPVISGKYPGKRGEKMLVHLIGKLSRLLQPSVLFVDGGEKPFYTKVPPAEAALKPTQLGGILKKVAKEMKEENMVMIIACSNQPWAGKAKPMLQIYQKVILLPRLDYGTCLKFWERHLLSLPGVRRDIDLSSLAKKTVYYQMSYLKECADKILTVKRRCELYFKPLTPEELYAEIISSGGVQMPDEEFAQFANFWNKTPMGAKDVKRQIEIQLELERERKAKEAEAKKKKQK